MNQKKSSSSPHAIKMQLLRLATDARKDFNQLSLEFALERLVVRLQSSTKLSDHLLFKGGFVMLRAYGSNRSTVDLDTSIHGLSIEQAELLAREVIGQEWHDGLWMGGIESQEMEHQNDYGGLRLTIRFSFGAPKANIKRLGKLILDIGVAAAITPAPFEAMLQPLLGGDPIH